MTTETALTDAEIFGLLDTCSDLPLHYEPQEIYAMGRAIEQAVLQSPDIRKAIAVSALVDQFFSSSNSIPVDRVTLTKAVVDAAITVAMGQKP